LFFVFACWLYQVNELTSDEIGLLVLEACLLAENVSTSGPALHSGKYCRHNFVNSTVANNTAGISFLIRQKIE
jgi:hypothetical protein